MVAVLEGFEVVLDNQRLILERTIAVRPYPR
jgi:hypothetical protein